MFAYAMKWQDDISLENTDRSRATSQLAMYAVHLSDGHSLFCKRIRLNTIKGYVKAAATFLALFGEVSHDYRYDRDGDEHFSPLLQHVYDELERYEKKTKRREAFTPDMLEYLCAVVKEQELDDNGMETALSEWFTVGLFAGLRLSEYAQNQYKYDPATPMLDIFLDPKAFCIGDFIYGTNTRMRMSAIEAAAYGGPDVIERCWITFRTQKNGQNSEERLFVRNTNAASRFCFVTATLKIVRRFIRLRGTDDTTTPLALYRELSTGRTVLVTSNVIEKVMRQCAMVVHKVKNDAELQLFSAHSLRVGACVILHTMGFNAIEIKWTLRWRSDAFMDYLRNTHVLATRQNRVLDEASAMPNFL